MGVSRDGTVIASGFALRFRGVRSGVPIGNEWSDGTKQGSESVQRRGRLSQGGPHVEQICYCICRRGGRFAWLTSLPARTRLKNAKRQGAKLPNGETAKIGLVEVIEAAQRHPLYTAPKSDGEGIGVAVGGWGGAFGAAAALCRVEPDGSLKWRAAPDQSRR